MIDNTVKRATIFIKGYTRQCKICGVSSFDHIHKEGTQPKDFEIITNSTKTPWTAKQSKSKRVANAISEVARQMVKGIANEYIDVEDTSAGRSAQRFWYEQAEIMLKGYVRKLKLTYKK